MATLTGYIKRMEGVTKAEKEVTDIWIGAKAAEFGTKMTDWEGFSHEFMVDDHVTVEYDEKPGNYKGKTIMYRNLRSIRGVETPASAPEEDESPFPPEPPQKPTKTASAPKDEAKPNPAPKPSPALPKNGGWVEAYSQSREAHESTRQSIEAQKAYEMAMAQVRDLVTVEKISPGSPDYEKMVLDLTHMGMKAMREARQVQKQG